MDWQTVAKAKFDSIFASIPEEWRLPNAFASSEQPQDITGPFITKHLTRREIEITETSAVDIVAKTSSGLWRAEEVTKAFCHRASLAHQMVGFYMQCAVKYGLTVC